MLTEKSALPLSRLQNQFVNTGLLNRRIAERHGKTPPGIPSLELVLVVRAEHLARFTKRQVLNRTFKVRKIDDHAHRGTVVGCCGFHGRTGSGLGKRADVEQSSQKGDALAQRMVKSQSNRVPPLPGIVTAAHAA